MPYACNLPDGTQVRLDDLPLGLWSDISRAAGLAAGEWYQAMLLPARWPAASVAMLEACAAHAGQDAPPVGYLTGATVLKVFVEVPDDTPDEYEDGLPDPKAKGEPKTGT